MASPAAVLDILLVANTKQANAALAKTQGQLVSTGKTATATSATFKKAMLGIGLAAGAAATALFKIGDEFDQVSDKIRTQTGASGKELKKLEGSFKNVVKTVPTDFGSAADAIAGLNQRLGLTGRPLEKLTKQVTQLAIVTGTDVKENVEAVTRLFGDWEVATKDQTETLDGLYRLSQQTGISVSELSRNLVQFGAPLRNLGVDMDFAAAMFANFEKTGVNMTTVLSGMRLGVGNLNSPTDDLAKTLDKLGISLKNPQVALVEIFDSIKTLDKQAATALGIQAFGKRAGPDLVDTVRGGKFELDKLIGSFQDGDETIAKAERSTRDFSEEWQLFINRVKTFLEPVATAFFKAIADGMKTLNRLDLDQVGKSLKDFWQSAGLLRDVVTKVTAVIKEAFRRLGTSIQGIVKVISGVLTGDFGRAWDGVKDIFRNAIDGVKDMLKAFTAPFRIIIERLAEIITDVFGGAWRSAKNIVSSAVDDIMGSVHLLTRGLDKGFGAIADFTNKALDTFGAKNKVKYDVGSINPFQKGGVVGAQTGILVPGTGSGDKVPAMLEPGEVVLNRKAVAAMGGANKANAINQMIPRFAGGGVVPGDTGGLHPGILGLVNSLYSRFGGSVTSGVRGADVGSLHSTGQAADYVPSDWAGASRAVNAVGSKLLEGIYNPGMFGGQPVSWESGSKVPSSFWAEEWGNHLDHIHLAIADGVNAAAVKVAKQIKRVMLQGPDGPLKSMGQAALDRVRNAANDLISKHSGSVFNEAGRGAQTAVNVSNLPKSLAKYNQLYAAHVAPDYGGYQMPVPAIVQLANWAGLPGQTFAKIAHGESNYRPGAIGIDPGGTRGYGLWQITTSYSDADVRAATGGTNYGQMLNPVLNAMAAKHKYDAAGGLSPWVGTQYLAKGGKVKGVTPSGYTFGQGPTTVDATPRPYNTLPKDVSDALFWLSANVANLEEQIANAEILAGFTTSEFGTALGPAEKAQQIALNDQLLAALMDNASWISKGLATPYLDPQVISDLTSDLNTIQGVTGQGGKILAVRQALDSLNATDTSSGPDFASIIALLEARNVENLQRLAVSQAQYGVFGGMPQVVGAGGFSSGGVAPQVSTTVNNNFGNGAMAWLEKFVDTRIDTKTRQDARGRPLPGSKGY